MNIDELAIVVGVVVISLFFVAWIWRILNGMAKSDAKKMTKNDMIQREINKRAQKGTRSSSGRKKLKGCSYIILIILLILLFSWIWLGHSFHP